MSKVDEYIEKLKENQTKINELHKLLGRFEENELFIEALEMILRDIDLLSKEERKEGLVRLVKRLKINKNSIHLEMIKYK